MGVNGGKLLHRYWGKRLVNPLGKTNLSDFLRRNFEAVDLDGGNSDIVPFEYSTYGNADMRIPSAEFTFSDGSRVSTLTYKGYEIEVGKPTLQGLPATYCEEGDKVETLTVHLEDTYQNADVFLSYSVFEDLDAITRSTKIVNRGEKLLLDSAMSATVDFYGSPEREILHLDGAWARERHITRQPIVPGNQGINSRYGCSSPFHNSFIALCDKNATENHGNVYGFNLVYSGNFTAGAERNSYNGVRAYIGINPTDFQFVLENGDSFQTPEAVLVYSANGLGEMSRIYHKLYRTRLCRGKYRDTERFVLINNWEATYFNFDEDKIVAIAEKASKVGIDTMVLDDGWFSSRTSDKNGLGDWYENRDRLPNGLEGLAKRINALGMRFGLWFEPEMVNPGTELYKNHPDWILHTKGRKSSLSRNQLTLDFSRDDVCNYIIDTLSDILSRANIEYIKWDMNRPFSQVGAENLENPQMYSYLHIMAVYGIVDELKKRHPQVQFESCASGGGRCDLGALSHFDQIWTSDNTDAVDRMTIQRGYSMLRPTKAMRAWVTDTTGLNKPCSLDFRFNVAMQGALGIGGNLTKYSGEDLEICRKNISFYKSVRDLVQFGDLYRISDALTEEILCNEYVSRDKNRAVVFIAAKGTRFYKKQDEFRLAGLDENKKYKFTLDGEEHIKGGAYLMNIGISMYVRCADYNRTIIFEAVK